MSLLCMDCGFNNPPGMRFCGNCGRRLFDLPDSQIDRSQAQPPSLVSSSLTKKEWLERIQQAGIEASGQHRNVTVLFVDLVGYTQLAERIDSEDLYELIQQFLELLANDVYKYDGFVDKFTGDGLMALFGAPIAHENNAELAILSALDMRRDVEQLSHKLQPRLGSELKVHIGLNAGSVIVGGVGSDFMISYTAIGDTVNLARRLEDVASPDVILVSESVYRQTKTVFAYQPPVVQQLKGISHPVRSFPLIGVKSRPGSLRGIEGLQAAMVGRDAELALLSQAVTDLIENDKGRIILVKGEAGIGKSRLKTELIRRFDHGEVNIWQGQSLTYRKSVAHWIFLDVLRNFLGVVPDTPEWLLRERLSLKVSKIMGGRVNEVLPYLEHMLSLSPSNKTAAERMRYLDAGQLRQQMFLSFRDLLVTASLQKPLLLILEDLHWADQASLDLLKFLLESVRKAPLMILAITRPDVEGGKQEVFEWASQHLHEHYQAIDLHHLSPEQSESLVLELLEIPELPSSLRDQVLQRAAGVPFYLEEILRMLIDEGIIRRDEGQWIVDTSRDIQALGVPDNLEGLIMARFDRLDEVQQRVLQVASAIGRQFSLPVLFFVLREAGEDQLNAALGYLVEREFILPQPDSPNTEYVFRHVLMSDAIYKTMLRREQSEIHGQIGKALEAVFAHRLEAQTEILARHYALSPIYDRALHFLILAGQKAARNYANEQARQNYEQALDLLSKVQASTNQILEIHRGLGDVLVFIGEYPLARQHFQTAMEVLTPEDNPTFAEQHSALLRRIGTSYERLGDYDEALMCLEKSQQGLDSAGEKLPVERAQTLNDIGWIQFRRGNIEEATKTLNQALSLVLDSTRFDVIASIYNRLGGVYYQKDRLDQASNYVRKSLVLREEMGDVVAVARSYNNLGLLGWRKGDWNAALEDFTRSVELHATLGDIEGMIQLHSNIGLLLTDKGDLQEAQRHLEESLKGAIQVGHSFMQGMAYHHLSRFWLAAAQWETSLDFSQQALNVFTEIGAQEYLVDLYASTGEAWLGLENVQQARKAGEKALELLDLEMGGSETMGKGRVYRLLANVSMMDCDLDSAADFLKESMELYNGPGNQLELGRTLVSLARLAQARHDMSAFRVHLKEAQLIFRQLSAKLDLLTVDSLALEQV